MTPGARTTPREQSSGAAVPGTTDAGGQAIRAPQLRPHPADDVPVLVTHRVLAPLLREHGVPGVLSREEQAAVLDPAVELAQQPVFLPREVRASDEAATGRVDLVLQR
jgi:hypothetical protein